MATISQIIPNGVQVPADDKGASLGGGMLVAVWLPALMAGTTYDIEYSTDDGTVWDPVTDEAGAKITITYLAGGHMAQINPPIRAPYIRLNSDTNETAARTIELHTV